MRILIVEDDLDLGKGLQQGLGQDGYAADWVQNAEAAEHAIRMEHFDLVVLDLGLPGRDGIDFLKDLRRQGSCVPVLILTARDTLPDRVSGLDSGGDDFLTKPFDLEELNARIRALARRSNGQASALVKIGDLGIDTARRQVTVKRRPVCLGAKEFAVLEALASHVDEVVPRARLEETVYSWGDEVASNALEVHVHNLRRKLGKQRIVTVRGVGYRLVSTVRP